LTFICAILLANRPCSAITVKMSAKVVTIFGDLMSQPSRAVIWFCKLAKIPHDVKLVQIVKKEQLSPEHLQRNPFAKVPTIEDNGFHVFESHTIMRYLAERYSVAEHWYPRNNLQQRTIVNEYLDWHHTNTRKCAQVVFGKYLAAKRGLTVTKEFLDRAALETESALDDLNARWLGNRPYLAGSEISIADISAACELAQLKVVKYDFSTRPNLYSWWKKMEATPHWDEVNTILQKVIAKL